MPKIKFSNPNRFARARMEKIKLILNTIKDNDGIHVEELSAMLKVNPPYLSDGAINDILISLHKDKQIKINDDGEVKICPKQ